MDLEGSFNPGNSETPLVSRLLYQLIDEKYRPLLDESSDLMCIVDREGKFIYVNKRFTDSLGYTKKEILGMHMNDVIAEECRHLFAQNAKEFLKNGKVRLPRFVLTTKLGGTVVGEMNCIVFWDHIGKYCGAKAVFKDHTRLLEIERLEKKYESMLEDGIDSLDYIIIILDKDFKVRWASSSVERYFGLDKTAIVGEDMRRIIRESLKNLIRQDDAFLKNIFTAYETKSAVESFECEIRRPEGVENCYVEHWSYPISHGDLLGGRIEIFRDITARKKSEETLEYYYKKIHAIMEHAVEGIVELKTDNTIQFVNKSLLAKMGYSEFEMLERPLTDFIVPEERLRLASVKLIRKAREVSFIKKDGTLLYGLVSSIPLVFGAQAPRALCFIADITEAKVVAFKLRDANLSLRALNDALLDVSLHDVRTGVYNERYLRERLTEELKRAKRYFRPFSLIMLDIDFFKSINDTFGHPYGDRILKEFAGLIKECVRATDIVVRSGGEEFVILCGDTDSFGALKVARKIARALKEKVFGDATKKISLTASAGVVSYPETGLFDAASLLKAADQAMYQSKDKGRHMITVFDQEGSGKKEESDGSALAIFDHIRSRLVNINLRNEESVLESLRPMAREVDKVLGYPHGYVERVLGHVDILAASLVLPEEVRRRIGRAALLCNLGLLKVPAPLLAKKRGLKKKEMGLIRQHPRYSLEMIRDISFLAPLRRDIFSHHERFDGRGYPCGLRGTRIPVGSRIILAAEVYEALIARRPYRRPLSHQEACRVIKNEAKKQLDPAVVDSFLKKIA